MNADERQRVQLELLVLALPHETPDGAVRLAERRAAANEIVGEIGRHHRARQRRPHALRLELALGERAGDGRQHQQQRVDRVEQHALVVLQILVVARSAIP